MRNLFRRLASLILLMVPAGARSAEMQTPATQPTSIPPDTAFAFALYHQLAIGGDAGGPANLIFSPLSVRRALEMVYPGAAGQTASQIAAVLHRGAGEMAPSSQKLFADATDALTLQSADAVWYERSLPLKPAFVEALTTAFSAALQPVDFSHDPDASRLHVNQWVEQKTHQRIKNLLPTGSVLSTTRLVLADAVYFKAAWQKAFKTAATHEQPFHLTPASTASVRMMRGNFEELPYAEDDFGQAVELSYARGQVRMVLIVPKDVLSRQQLAEWASAAEFRNLFRDLTSTRVLLAMPKFTATTDAGLKPALTAMGMPDAFDRARADFSGMLDSPERLCIDAVYHKAFIDIDENGTEAAAATAISMVTAAAAPARESPRIVTADRPFFYLIRDASSGTILFMGSCTDPRG